MFSCLRKTCLSSGLPTNILPDLPVVCSWTVLLNKISVLECVRVSVCAGCMCVRGVCVHVLLCVIGLSGSTLSPQTGCSLYRIWCHILSDVCLPTGTFGQESTCPKVRVCEWACVFSSQPSTRRHFLDWCLSLGAGGRGSSTGRELIMQRDLERWLSRLELYSCHTGHGVHCAAQAVVCGELRHTDSRDRVKMRKRSEAVGLCVVKLEWVILDG